MNLKTFDINIATAMTKLMARENLTVDFKDTSTAYCDPKNRVITFPIRFVGLDRDVMSVFSAHETSHALYSPSDFREEFDKYGPHVVMVFEDIRIENKIKDDYAGLKSIFHRGYEKLHYENDFFGIEKHDIDVNELSFIDRINLKAKLRDLIDIDFSDEEQDFFDRADRAQTWDDVVLFCEEYVERFKEKEPPTSSLEENNESFPDADSLNFSDEGETKDFDLNPKEAKNGGESDNNNITKTTGNGGGSGNIKNPPKYKEGITDQESNDWQENFDNDDDDDDNKPVNSPLYNSLYGSNYEKSIARILEYKEIEKFIIPWSKISDSRGSIYESTNESGFFESNSYRKTKQNIQQIAKVMASEFESKKSAARYARAKTAKSGNIDLNKLFKYQYEDDIFLKTMQLPDDKNHGMILMVDISGSMHVTMKSVILQILILVEYCRMTGIPYEVYAFSNASFIDDFNWESEEGVSLLDETMGGYRYYLNWFSSKMKKEEYERAFKELLFLSLECKGLNGLAGGIYDTYSGTPLNEAKLDSIPLTDEFIRRTRVEKFSMIYLTDGEGSPINVPRYVSWKNKIFAFDNQRNDYYQRVSLCKSKIHQIYKSVFSDYDVINLFIDGSLKSFRDYEKNGFLKFGPKDITENSFSREKSLLSGFDYVYLIDQKVVNNIKNSFTKKVRSLPESYFNNPDEVLKSLEDSFNSVSNYKKKSSLIAKSIMEILV